MRVSRVVAVLVLALAGCHRVQLSGLSFAHAEGWLKEDPVKEFRAVQYRLPSGEQGVNDARLVVYYFGRAGAGTPEANLDRWCGQFEQADGRPSREAARTTRLEIRGLEVHELDLSGRYVAATSPGSGEHHDQPGFRMLAAVVATEAGPYYFKLVGPQAAVTRWEKTWRAMIASIRPADAVPEASG